MGGDGRYNVVVDVENRKGWEEKHLRVWMKWRRERTVRVERKGR